jgi:hypothetical protein
MNTQQKSISADFYYFLQSIGSRYEGHVEGVGYVSSELVLGVSPRPEFPNQSRLGFTKNDSFLTSKYVSIVIPTVDTDSKYDGVTESDILEVVRKKNLDGSIRVNMGNNQIVELSPGSFVNVRIREEVFGGKRQKVVTIFTRDAETGSQHETKMPLNGIEYVLKEDTNTLRLPDMIDGMPVPSTLPDGGGYGMKDILSETGSILAYMGLAVTCGQVMTYDSFLKIWQGKNHKIYSHSWGGNQYTGGKNKYAFAKSQRIGKIGKGMGVASGVIVLFQAFRGDITWGWAFAEGGSIAFSTLGGSIGLAWGVGWELGRWITTWESYQRFKFNFFYDYWESKVGPPSDSNKELWRYFYENYKF